jgi:hypothetical protein
MKHTIISVDVLADKIYHEASIRYIVKGDDQEVLLQALTGFGKLEVEDKISYSHSYMDPGPLQERERIVEERKR